jgi:hypothetical protein
VNESEQRNQPETAIKRDARDLRGSAAETDEAKKAGDNRNEEENEGTAEHESEMRFREKRREVSRPSVGSILLIMVAGKSFYFSPTSDGSRRGRRLESNLESAGGRWFRPATSAPTFRRPRKRREREARRVSMDEAGDA